MSIVENAFVDLSGITATSANPYDALIEACSNDATQIQLRYDAHRRTRNEQQRAKLLASDFPGVVIDPVLFHIVNPQHFPGFMDPRHCLVFWARPSQPIRSLVHVIQQRLCEALPNLWLMPLDCLHMTTLEVTHSLTAQEIDKLVHTLRPKAAEITDFTLNHHARLVKPLISYDAAAMALSFLPAAGEGLEEDEDSYTYHHLRRDLYNVTKSGGVTIASRYTVPSAHLTIGRFVTQEGLVCRKDGDLVPDPSKIKGWVEAIEAVNDWLEENYWPKKGASIPRGGEWIVGQEKGLDFRQGTLWYGGGETIRLGTGF